MHANPETKPGGLHKVIELMVVSTFLAHHRFDAVMAANREAPACRAASPTMRHANPVGACLYGGQPTLHLIDACGKNISPRLVCAAAAEDHCIQILQPNK